MADAPFNFYRDPEHEPFVFSASKPDDAVEAGALLLHGFMGSPKELRPLGRALAARGISAHGVLLPGFGADVERLRAVTRADWLRAARASWADVRGRYGRTVLLGFSMGGAVALHLAAERAPERLILLAPFSRFSDRRAVALPLLRHVLKEFRPYEKADFGSEQVRWDFRHIDPNLDLSDPAMQERLRRDATIPTTSLVQLQALCRSANGAARRSTAPTLIVQGVGDDISRPGDTRRLARSIGGRLRLIEVEADHMLPFDDRPWWPAVRDLVVGFATEDAAR